MVLCMPQSVGGCLCVECAYAKCRRPLQADRGPRQDGRLTITAPGSTHFEKFIVRAPPSPAGTTAMLTPLKACRPLLPGSASRFFSVHTFAAQRSLALKAPVERRRALAALEHCSQPPSILSPLPLPSTALWPRTPAGIAITRQNRKFERWRCRPGGASVRGARKAGDRGCRRGLVLTGLGHRPKQQRADDDDDGGTRRAHPVECGTVDLAQDGKGQLHREYRSEDHAGAVENGNDQGCLNRPVPGV